MTSVISVRNITKRYGDFLAIDNISLDVENEYFTLLGSSGSGKTTLLRIIAGLERPDEGEVRINGRLVNDLPPNQRDIGMVFQDFLLFPHRTVAENIIFPLRMRNVDKGKQKQLLDWVLEKLRIDNYGHRYPNQLSGGQQQRTALARGLVSRPSALLLDEPLANLDLELRKEMETELRRYRDELNIPFIYVTHNQEEALVMSDRIGVMRNGRFEQVGTTTEIYGSPRTPFVAGFVGHANRLVGRLSSIASDGRSGAFGWNGSTIGVTLPPRAKAGETVVSFVKSEKMRIVPADFKTSNENVLIGTIRDVVFKGQLVDYFVIAGGGEEVTVTDSSGAPAFAKRDGVKVVWGPEASSTFLSERID
jgi:putative spermidine/putrescine transport system ATP-binding protein/spermidine/putrescine transport system ATP-binding protein